MSPRETQHWFVRLFALAVIAHFVVNPPLGPDAAGLTALAAGGAACLLAVQPSDRRLLVAACVLVPVTAWQEAPQLGNHWLLMSFVSVAILVSQRRTGWWERFAPTGRWMLIGFYSFAAFAKLNTAFFDSTASCSVFYANQSLSSWGLPLITPGSGIALATAIMTAVIELSIPLLLLVDRTRHIGVALGYAFHTLISLDLDQHFYDFTAVLFALFILFAPTAAARLERSVEPHLTPARRAVVATMLGLFVLAAVLPLSRLSLWLLTTGFFFVWIPTAIALTVATSWRLRTPDWVGLRVSGLAATLLLALVGLNGLSPYLELKTGFGFNMYSNLVTANGESNHLIVPGTAQLTAGHADAVVIIATDDPALEAYVDSGYAVAFPRLAHYLADHPDTSVTYRSPAGGEPTTVQGAEVGRHMAAIPHKLAVFRSIDLQVPARCQSIWLPAL